MEPTFVDGDVLRVSMFFVKIDVDDIVVLHDPRDKKLILKRVESIGSGLYFVSGDNRESSTDSRKFGGVTRKDIVGKVLKRLT